MHLNSSGTNQFLNYEIVWFNLTDFFSFLALYSSKFGKLSWERYRSNYSSTDDCRFTKGSLQTLFTSFKYFIEEFSII